MAGASPSMTAPIFIAGYRMRPLQAVHIVTLEAIDSPLLAHEGREVALIDVQLAAKICAAEDPAKSGALEALRVDHALHALHASDEAYVRQEAQALVNYIDAHLPEC